jgi:hypothetical protein
MAMGEIGPMQRDEPLGYTVFAVGEQTWRRHVPTLEEVRRVVGDARDAGCTCVIVVDEARRRTVHHDFAARTLDYSVHLPGALSWEEHIPSLAAARFSAEELRAMGMDGVYIVDDTTGEVIE